MLKVEEIRELIQLIDASSINEFTYESSEAKVTLKKNINEPQPIIKQVESVVPGAVELPNQVEMAETNQTPNTEQEQTIDYDYEIVSPMVGTLYSAATPESDPYVSIGSKVDKDQVVCIVEAMKLFNEIEAEVSGEIVEILVENGELVEYGQPLFRVKK